METATLYTVVLAGGSGKRLWPLSRTHLPKQLLPLTGSVTLLEKTLERVSLLVPRERCWLVTTALYLNPLRALVGDRVGNLLVEPCARNTAPAMLLSCNELAQRDPHAVVMFMPADHVIHDYEKFKQTVARAAQYAQTHDEIVLMGIPPKYAATEYGYIETGALGDDGVFHVERFHEKPSQEVADWYSTMSSMLWNSGIICARVSVFLQEFAAHAPELVASLGAYEALPAVSIDYAVLEKSLRVAVIKADFGWSDVGTLETFIAAARCSQQQQGLELLGAQNNLVYAPKPVVLVGVEDLCVIDTGDFVCIMPREATTRSHEIAETLKNMGHKDYA